MTNVTADVELRVPTGARTSVNQLFERWQQHGDQRAREQLVERFMPIARKLAHRYKGAYEPPDDLLQVASLGLLKAIDRYDTTRETGFQSFAVPTILGELKRYFRDCGWAVHMPRGVQDLAVRVERAQRELLADNGRAPTFNELAEYLELSIEDVLDAVQASAAHHSISFDAPREDADGDTSTLADSIGQIDHRFELVDLGASIGRAAKHLPERERQVLALSFLADQTQNEIAQQIGVSQMQVSRILAKAVATLSAAVEERPQSQT